MPPMPGGRKHSEEQLAGLQRVRRARRRSDQARADLDAAIHQCSEAGCSLRAISEAARMSRQRVHQILRGE